MGNAYVFRYQGVSTVVASALALTGVLAGACRADLPSRSDVVPDPHSANDALNGPWPAAKSEGVTHARKLMAAEKARYPAHWSAFLEVDFENDGPMIRCHVDIRGAEGEGLTKTGLELALCSIAKKLGLQQAGPEGMVPAFQVYFPPALAI